MSQLFIYQGIGTQNKYLQFQTLKKEERNAIHFCLEGICRLIYRKEILKNILKITKDPTGNGTLFQVSSESHSRFITHNSLAVDVRTET